MEESLNKTPRTGLSAGLAVYEALSESTAVTSRITSIYPVNTSIETPVPCICYRVAAIDPTPTKTQGAADTVTVEVYCMAPDYPACVELAEAVRDALDNLIGETDSGMRVSNCRLIDQSEDYQYDAYVKLLIFNMSIK